MARLRAISRDPVRSAVSRIATETRWHGEATTEAVRDLALAKIARIVADAPPMSDEQLLTVMEAARLREKMERKTADIAVLVAREIGVGHQCAAQALVVGDHIIIELLTDQLSFMVPDSTIYRYGTDSEGFADFVRKAVALGGCVVVDEPDEPEPVEGGRVRMLGDTSDGARIWHVEDLGGAR